MLERFVSEAIQPAVTTFDTARMAAGEPGLPREFIWRGRTFMVACVRKSWRETGSCRHGSSELYVRKHWYEVVTTSRETMKIYCDRQARGGRGAARWWLFSVRESGDRLTVYDHGADSTSVADRARERRNTPNTHDEKS